VDRPNIVVIVADDLGWNDVGYHGSEIQTPRIDQLAAEGVILNRFYAQPTCSPTRASLLTGNSAVKLGVVAPLSTANPEGLPLDQRLLPQFLQASGYQTALIGKWHLGFRKEAYLPTSRGFNHFYGSLTGGIGHWDHVNGGGLDWQRNGQTLREEGYSTHLLTDEALRLIHNTDSGRPLFLMLSFNAPHLPNEAPLEAVAAYEKLPDPKRRQHAAMVSEIDSAIGQLVDELQRRSMLENTLLWFLSDNGGLNTSSFSKTTVEFVRILDRWFPDEKVPFQFLEFVRTNVRDGAADNSPLRKGKKSIYEGGVRVPSFVYWSGRLKPHHISRMITVQDITPTLLSVIESAVPDERFDGVDQWAWIEDKHHLSNSQPPDYIVKSWDGEAVFRYPWKLVTPSSGDPELYHLESDPEERDNLYERHPAIAGQLRNIQANFPRGPSVHLPLYYNLMSEDSFGGTEKHPPWTSQIK
jgi:arylsulfatase A-like enzyme